MRHIRVRDHAGIEHAFSCREEFQRALEDGGISPEWQIFHSAGDRWLPIEVHPDYQAAIRGPGEGDDAARAET
jgi:hypothetical protein